MTLPRDRPRAQSEEVLSLEERGQELERALRLRLPLAIPREADTVRDLVAALEAARAQITALAQEKAELTKVLSEHVMDAEAQITTLAQELARSRADEEMTEQARLEAQAQVIALEDGLTYRLLVKRAESAEAQVAALTVQLQTERADIARANGLLEAYYNPNFGPDLPDANVWYVAQCVVEHIHALDAEVAALTVQLGFEHGQHHEALLDLKISNEKQDALEVEVAALTVERERLKAERDEAVAQWDRYVEWAADEQKADDKKKDDHRAP